MDSDITKVWKLLEVSDAFLKRAKNSVKSSDQYNTFVKCSLDCLFNVIKLYGNCLNGQIESTIYYKISNLIFQESVSYDLAREYCVKGIQICKRNGPQLINIKFQLQYLNIQIQMRSNANEMEVISYLNEVINEIPDLDEFIVIKILFKFTKITKFDINGVLNSRMKKMEELLKEFEPQLNEENFKFYEIIVFNIIQMKLTNNSPVSEIKSMVNKLDKIKFNQPIQFKGIRLLIDINVILQLNDYSKIKHSLKELNSFLKTFANGWEDSIIIKLMSGFSIEFKWISYEEYSIQSFLILGISNMIKDDDSSSKIFNKCKKLINEKLEANLSSNKLTLNEVSLKGLKLNLQLYLIDFYLIIIDLMKNEYPEIKEDGEIDFSKYDDFNKLIERFQSNTLNQYELFAFDDFKYLIIFLNGMIYQNHNQLDKSILNYRMILSTINGKPQSIKKNQIKDLLGLPNYLTNQKNQIISISLINILPMIEKKVNEFKLEQTRIDELDDEYSEIMKKFEINLKMKQMVLNKLDDLIKEMKDQDCLIYMTILNLKIALNTVNNYQEEEIINLFKSVVDETDEKLITPIPSSPNAPIDNTIENTKRTISLIPIFKSLIYFTIGENFKSNTSRYSIQDNVNLKIMNYSKSIEFSKGPRGNIKLTNLSNNRISKIKEKNTKLYKN